MTEVMRLLDEFRHLKNPIVYKGVLRAGNIPAGNGLESAAKRREAALNPQAKEPMAKKLEGRTYDEALNWLREHQFDVLEAPGTKTSRIFVKKYNCSAAIEKTPEDAVKVFAYPGYLIGGEIAKLVNKGYQQVLKTTKTEIAATADHLKALHQFTEELKEALGKPSLYNESLGTVSDAYAYDRVEGRDKPDATRPKRPWEELAAAGKPGKRA